MKICNQFDLLCVACKTKQFESNNLCNKPISLTFIMSVLTPCFAKNIIYGCHPSIVMYCLHSSTSSYMTSQSCNKFRLLCSYPACFLSDVFFELQTPLGNLVAWVFLQTLYQYHRPVQDRRAVKTWLTVTWNISNLALWHKIQKAVSFSVLILTSDFFVLVLNIVLHYSQAQSGCSVI